MKENTRITCIFNTDKYKIFKEICKKTALRRDVIIYTLLLDFMNEFNSSEKLWNWWVNRNKLTSDNLESQTNS